MKINERGYWENDNEEGHGVDPGLAMGLLEWFKKKKATSVIDIGCGNGYYTKYLLDRGINCVGYDGNPYTPQITNGLCNVADFSQPQHLGKFDWVLSLEVGEHIPAEYEKVFIENLVRHAEKGIVLSWAIEGQGGDGHVNCHSNGYIIEEIQPYGFNYSIGATTLVKTGIAMYPEPCWWFRHSVMVFYKETVE